VSLAERFDRIGCTGHVHAVTLDGAREVALRADEEVPPASVLKVLVALTVERLVAEGAVDGRRRLRLGVAERTPGPVGMSLFEDDAEISVRDAVTLMLTISDNVASDALIDLVGVEAVDRVAADLGLRRTRLGCDLRRLVELGPDKAPMRTTARDMTSLLRAVWEDRAGPPEACARLRWQLRRQLTRDRLAAAFGPEVEVSAKSGGLMGLVRHEVGVVRFPDGQGYAVAVLTSATEPRDPRMVDAAIAEAARTAVAELRQGSLVDGA
jgi:beta-lactamase class A